MSKASSKDQVNNPPLAEHPAPKESERAPSVSEKRKARLYDILEFLAKKSRTGNAASNAEIQDATGVTASTLVGYLTDLAEVGLVDKVSEQRGLYRLHVQSLEDVLFLRTEYEGRRQSRKRIKDQVAKACVEYEVHGGSLLGSKCCLISHGTSTEPLFRELRNVDPSKRPEKIITNSIPGILELLDFPEIALTIVGGALTREKGGIQPIQPLRRLSTEGAAEERSTAEWLGTENFDTAILSCSSIAPDGRIWCNDGMDEFRSGVLATKEIQFIVLADSSKLKTMSGGKKLTTTIEWHPERTWLFVDDKKTPENRAFFDKFEEILKDHFVRVKVSDSSEGAKEQGA